ncbi:MAG: C39 family peptidase [Propionivibrio sp.]|nr:C39 family peptidase [Propionivibrio sp.]
MIQPPLRRMCRLLPLLAALLATHASSVLASEGSRVALPSQFGGAFSVPVASIKGLHFHNTMHQKYDFSCGSAALATMLTHHYAYPVSEQDVFREMYERGDQNKIRKEGFSLLDMKNYLEAHGFEGDGFVAEIEQLQTAGIPAIALIKENGYYHFVVIKGMRKDRVLIGDPSAGTRTMPYTKFKGLWVNHILFVIRNKLELAKFNTDNDWRVAPSAPYVNSVHRGAAEPFFPKRGPSDY